MIQNKFIGKPTSSNKVELNRNRTFNKFDHTHTTLKIFKGEAKSIRFWYWITFDEQTQNKTKEFDDCTLSVKQNKIKELEKGIQVKPSELHSICLLSCLHTHTIVKWRQEHNYYCSSFNRKLNSNKNWFYWKSKKKKRRKGTKRNHSLNEILQMKMNNTDTAYDYYCDKSFYSQVFLLNKFKKKKEKCIPCSVIHCLSLWIVIIFLDFFTIIKSRQEKNSFEIILVFSCSFSIVLRIELKNVSIRCANWQAVWISFSVERDREENACILTMLIVIWMDRSHLLFVYFFNNYCYYYYYEFN